MENILNTNIVATREFWDRKVARAIQMFEYGGWNEQKFVGEMVRLGYKEDNVLEAIYDG